MAKSSLKGLMDGIKKDVTETSETSADAGQGAFKHRLDSLPKSTQSRKNELKMRHQVEAGRCRIWAHHDRRYDLLNEETCRDLIEGFQAQGQQIPAIVREINDGGDCDYEVICGARRHWTASHLQVPYLIEVHTLNDRQAFEIADAENRQRDDISDYERSVFYADALGRYYKTQTDMADALNVSIGWLSEYIALAAFPVEVVDAFTTIDDIKVSYSRKLRKPLSEPKLKKRILAKAIEIKGQKLNGAAVVKALLEASKPKRGGGQQLEKKYELDGKHAFTLTKTGRGGLNFKIAPKIEGDFDELERMLLAALREHMPM